MIVIYGHVNYNVLDSIFIMFQDGVHFEDFGCEDMTTRFGVEVVGLCYYEHYGIVFIDHGIDESAIAYIIFADLCLMYVASGVVEMIYQE